MGCWIRVNDYVQTKSLYDPYSAHLPYGGGVTMVPVPVISEPDKWSRSRLNFGPGTGPSPQRWKKLSK